ncbi:SurA N-terminal domain-containing protein [Microbacterium karelineae]|uniref:SurA N-terminal domain-containing protein n=1 Tax=Microbacterium karelineae TaxID=2654283 RepID=UPI0012EA4F1F|nr:SurA N-terminal domain-containing protein [Microbacterium karelineae]
MSITRKILAASVVAALALTGCSVNGEDADETPAPTASADAQSGAPEADLDGLPDVVAVVNGEEIGLEEFSTAYETQFQQAAMSQQQTGQEIDQDQLKQQVAELLINNRLLTQAATGAGIEPSDDDIEAILKDAAEQNGMGSVEEVIEAFGEQGVSEEQVRRDAASQFQIDGYIEAETDIEPPSDEELREQYDAVVEQATSQGDGSEEAGEIPPFKDVKDQLAQQAMTQKQNAAIEEILGELRESGEVEIRL